MSVFVVGGTGFIGYRLVRLLVARGETVTCMDSNPGAHSFADVGPKVSSIRGDVAQFEDVMSAMSAANPERVVNLAYLIGTSLIGRQTHGLCRLVCTQRQAVQLREPRRHGR